MRRTLFSLLLGLAGPTASFGGQTVHDSILHLRQFIEQPGLMAQSGQTVILDGLATDADRPGIRYQLQSGSHEFCLEDTQSYFSGMILEDAVGQEILRLHKNESCAKADLVAGVYTLRLSHSSTVVPNPDRVARVSADLPNPRLTDGTEAVGGFWAVQPDPNQDTQHRDGRLRALPPFVDDFWGIIPSPSAMPVIADYTATQMDQYALFRFQYGGSSDLAPFYPMNTVLDVIGIRVESSSLPWENMGIMVVGNYTCNETDLTDMHKCWLHRDHLAIYDLGHYQFEFQRLGRPLYYVGYTSRYAPGPVWVPFSYPFRPTGQFAPTGPFRVIFRFFPDGNVGTLQDGEVALFEKCDYQGKAVVLGAALANFLEWNSDTVALDKLGASIQLGNNTAITFYTNPNFEGAFQTVAEDMSCLASLPKAASIQMQTAESILLSSGNCPKCKLNGLDLSDRNLTGANLTGAYLVGSKLNRTVLNDANLTNTDFSNAVLFGAQLNKANLTGASLYHAFLSNDTEGNITEAASLQQAHLKNVNLSFAQLSGVDFTYANFYGDNAAGEGECQTSDSNYAGFTQGCASAHSATMADTKFTNGYLYGVDFTNATGQGVSFLQAVLTGANFAGATFSADPQSGSSTTFYRSFLQGANLSGATFTGNVNMSDAFVDFRNGGNNIFIYLDGANHNAFTCDQCSPPHGQDVCVEVNYPQATAIPQDQNIICPDGSLGTCGPVDKIQHWQSTISEIGAPPPGVPPAWYDTDATYTKAPANRNVICRGKGENAAIILW